jgi:GNAT superfamily N-acetyltransferase
VSLERLEEIVSDPNKFLIIVEEEGKVLAIALFTRIVCLSRIAMLYDDLCVSPESRGKGIGKAIDVFLIELAKEQDCDCIELVVPVPSVPVQRQHLKTGFTFRSQLAMGKILKHWETK